MKIKIFSSRELYQMPKTLDQLQNEINEFIKNVDFVDIKHEIKKGEKHYFTVLYEEKESE